MIQKSKNIFIHIGLHKTATTTLQRQYFPACNDVNLLTTRLPEVYKFVHYACKSDPLFFDTQIAKQLLDPLIDSDKINILSNEMLSGPPFSGAVEPGLDHRSPILNNLQSVYPEAKIIIVIRKQNSLAQSFYRQYLFSGGTYPIDRFYGFDNDPEPPLMSLDRFTFSPYIKELHRLFPSGVLVLPFESFIKNQDDFLRNFAEFVGFTAPNIVLSKANATKLGPLGFEVTRYLNHVCRNKINRGIIPGIPLLRDGRIKFVSIVRIINDNWPFPVSKNKNNQITLVTDEIHERNKEDNCLLDEQYNLNLKEYGYY